MLKHSDIIEKLEPLQKVAIVASALERAPLEQAGIEPVGKASLQQLSEGRGVSYVSAARSWDGELVRGMTEELAAEAGANGAKLFVTPDLKVATDPMSPALSEDACLNGTLGREMVGAIHSVGGAAALSQISLTQEEVAYLDRREDRAAVYDLVAKPFLLASAKEPCEAVLSCPNRINSGYPDTNRVLFTDALNGYFGKDAFVVGEGASPSPDTFSLLRGKVSLGGAKLSMERAVRRYRQLVKYRDEGSMPARELEDALREGSALSEDKLNEAADEVVDFCECISALNVEGPATRRDMRRKTADASIVLLRNENRILPLKEGTRIAVIGEVYRNLTALSGKFEIVGQAQGYERRTDRSDALLPEAIRLAGSADVALVFLYPDEGRSFSLPANRIALLSALQKTGTPVIGLVCGDRPVDMAFDSSLAATLLVPADGPFAGGALARVLSGQFNPCGKLTRTAYDNTDAYFSALQKEKNEGRLRVGGFVGYQRYVTAQESVRYPFGYGLSYTSFTYSRLFINGNTVTFTVRNSGAADGNEVAQIYVGAPSISCVRSAVCLKAFRKVFLRAGESATVSVELPDSAFASFEPRTLGESVETGSYQILVGASSLDIRLRGRRYLRGVTRERTDEAFSDFFPNAARRDVTYVPRAGRVGEEVKLPPKGLRAARKAARYLLPAVAIVFFLLFAMLAVSYAFDYVLFFALNETVAEWILYGIAVTVLAVIPLIGAFNRKRLVRLKTFSLAVCPVLLFICFILGYLLVVNPNDLYERIAITAISCFAAGTALAAIVAGIIDRELRLTDSGANRWAKYYYVPARVKKTTSETEFEEAFRVSDAEREASLAGRQEAEPLPVEVPQFYDRHLTYRVLLDDCKQFVTERGTAVEENTLREWIAALSATQLILVPQGGGADLCAAVAGYFGREPYIDNAEQYLRAEDLFSRWKQSERIGVSTQLSAAIAAARRESAFLHTVLIRHTNAAILGQLFAPVLDVLARRKTAISFPDAADVIIPPNLRIVVEVEEERVGQLPASVAEVAAVLTPSVGKTEPSLKKSVMQSVGYERFAALQQSVRDDFPLSEATWKSVDRLDEHCRAAHIGNMLWLKMERHASAAVACGAEEAEALKGALGAELYPWLVSTWDKELCGGELNELIAELFGYKTTAQAASRGRKE